MILTAAQARAAADAMRKGPKGPISIEMPAAHSPAERVKVVHESNYGHHVLVWQTVGGIAHGEEKYPSRAAFFAAYGISQGEV